MLRYFNFIDLHVPRDLKIHAVLDNLSTHKAPAITSWLADPKHARWHLHFTSTSSSWCNLVERPFGSFNDLRIRRGTITSVTNLMKAIQLWAEHWNDRPNPLVWTSPSGHALLPSDNRTLLVTLSRQRTAALRPPDVMYDILAQNYRARRSTCPACIVGVHELLIAYGLMAQVWVSLQATSSGI